MTRVVLIESPYRNGDRDRNLRYLAWCEYHAESGGELPIASHGNCTAYIAEDDEGRKRGFAWRAAVADLVAYVVYYTDLGISEGAAAAYELDVANGRKCETRCLPSHLLRRFEAGEYPPGSMRRVWVKAEESQ